MATEKKVFSGTYIDGLDIDLFEWAGVQLSDEQKDLMVPSGIWLELCGALSSDVKLSD
jgi:hypothetical protein